MLSQSLQFGDIGQQTKVRMEHQSEKVQFLTMTLISCSCRHHTNLCPLLSITHYLFLLLHFYSHFFQSIPLSPLHPSSFYSISLLPLWAASPSPLRESNHGSSANQRAQESIKHHTGNMSPGSWCYERFSGEGWGAMGEGRCAAVPRWDKVGIVMGVTYEGLPSPPSYLHTYRNTLRLNLKSRHVYH